MVDRHDVMIIGASVGGAGRAGRGQVVLVPDRGGLASGGASSGEGILLISEKLPGSELDLC